MEGLPRLWPSSGRTWRRQDVLCLAGSQPYDSRCVAPLGGCVESARSGSTVIGEALDWVAKRHMIESYMERKGCGWDDPRMKLMDLQYHDVRPDKGLFYTLERSRLIERIVEEDDIQRAELNPPTGTRAYFRGRCVSKFAKALYGASWTSVLFDVGNTTIKKVPLMDPRE